MTIITSTYGILLTFIIFGSCDARSESNVDEKYESSNDTSYEQKLNLLPDRKSCGLLSDDDRIFGGDIAAPDEFPWLARIKYRLKNGNEVYACAGSLITDRHLITAAHCVVNLTIAEIRLGEQDVTDNESHDDKHTEHPVYMRIDRAIVFPEYARRNLFKGDIALLRLERPVNFTDYIRPICLPTTEFSTQQDYLPNTEYWTAGWGQTENEKRSSTKRKVKLDSIPMSICRTTQSLLTDNLAPYAICAGGEQGKDTCAGDSGGSIVKQISEGMRTNWILYGITSYGYKDCGSEGRPGLYARITPYMDWIVRNLD